MRGRFRRYKLVWAHACTRIPALPTHPNQKIVGFSCGTAYVCICHCGGVMRRQSPSRPGSHGLHILYVRYFNAVLPHLRLPFYCSIILLYPLFADRPCMSAASSYAGSRGVTMNFLPNAQRPCLAKYTNVSIVASLPYLLFCGPSLRPIITNPFVSQISLASTSQPFHRNVRIIPRCPTRQTAQQQCHSRIRLVYFPPLRYLEISDHKKTTRTAFVLNFLPAIKSRYPPYCPSPAKRQCP